MFNKYRWKADQSQFFLLKLYLFYCLSGSTAVTIPLYTLLISRHTWVECLERRRLSGCLTDTDGCLTVDRWPAPQPPHHWALTAADWSRRRTHTHTHAHTRTVLEIFIGQTSPCLCTPEDLDFGCGSIVWLCRPVSEHPISYRNSLNSCWTDLVVEGVMFTTGLVEVSQSHWLNPARKY